MKKILIIAPHPDDELVGCGGVYLQNARRGNHVEVIYLTSGAKRGEKLKSNLRKQAVIHIASDLGVKKDRLHFYDFAELSDLLDVKKLGIIQKKLIEDIKKIKPNEIFVTAYEGGHIDHDIANFLVDCCRSNIRGKKSFRNIKYFEYEVYNNYLNWSLFSFIKILEIILREIVKRTTKNYFYWDRSRFPPVKGFQPIRLSMSSKLLKEKLKMFDKYRMLAEKPLEKRKPRKLLRPYKERDLIRNMPIHNYMKEPHKRFILPLGYELAWGISFSSFSKIVAFVRK